MFGCMSTFLHLCVCEPLCACVCVLCVCVCLLLSTSRLGCVCMCACSDAPACVLGRNAIVESNTRCRLCSTHPHRATRSTCTNAYAASNGARARDTIRSMQQAACNIRKAPCKRASRETRHEACNRHHWTRHATCAENLNRLLMHQTPRRRDATQAEALVHFLRCSGLV